MGRKKVRGKYLCDPQKMEQDRNQHEQQLVCFRSRNETDKLDLEERREVKIFC